MISVEKIQVSCRINGQAALFEAFPMERLLDIIREKLVLTGTKEGCGEGECGACSVFMNGELVNSCLVPAIQAQGAEFKTVEGLANGSALHEVQEAFLKHGGAQCGICTPGMMMAAVNLLDQCPDPTDAQIREALAGNLCRCTGYMKIFDSVLGAAKMMRGLS